MKPKQLKPPTTWEERKVLISDRVWYVPEYYSNYQDFCFPGWGSPELFGNDRPVVIEFCSGNGSWIADRAQENPHWNWLAVEKRFDRARKIWAKLQNTELANLVVLCGEGQTATKHYFPKETVHQIYINFPDPWPKKRHAKHRLIQGPFVEELWRILQIGGEVHLVTDDVAYSEAMIDAFQLEPGFVSQLGAPYYVHELPGYGSSFFEELWRQKGRQIRYHQFQKRVRPC